MVSKEDCLIWAGRVNRFGYGIMSVTIDGKSTSQNAHRAIYEGAYGVLPRSIYLDHLCKNKSCINLDHLEEVTNQENGLRYHRGQTHCRNGHAYANNEKWYEENGKVYRRCVKCRLAFQEKRKHSTAPRTSPITPKKGN